MSKEIATVTMEGTRKRGRSRRRWRDEVEENLNKIWKKREAGDGQRPSGMEEDCTGNQGPQRTAVLEKKIKIQKTILWDFRWLNPCGRTVPLGSTQPLTEMSTGNISWEVKVAGALGWQPYHLHVPISWNVWEPQPPGTLRVCSGLYRYCFTIL